MYARSEKPVPQFSPIPPPPSSISGHIHASGGEPGRVEKLEHISSSKTGTPL